jgi:hypothetical protein
MIVVDTWLAYSLCTGIGRANGREENQKDFCTALTEELVDNQYDNVGSCRVFVEAKLDNDSPALSRTTGEPRSGLYAHLSPTKKGRTKMIAIAATDYKDNAWRVPRRQHMFAQCAKMKKHLTPENRDFVIPPRESCAMRTT